MLKQTVLTVTFALVRNYNNITDTNTVSLESSTIDNMYIGPCMIVIVEE